MFAIFITKSFNLCLNKEKFPKILKIFEVTPICKKENPLEKDNYQPIMILFNIPNMYKKLICNQMNDFFTKKLSKYQFVFRKEFGA